MNFLRSLALQVCGLFLFILIGGYIAKKLFEFLINGSIDKKKSELGKDLENFKMTISNQAQIHKLELDKNLEVYKNSLQQASQEHQIRFSKLHIDRAEIIKDLFAKLVKMEFSMESFINPLQWSNDVSQEEKSKIAAMDGNDFIEFYYSRELLFNQETCKLINELNGHFKDAYNAHSSYLRAVNDPLRYGRAHREKIDPYFDIMKKEIPKIKKLLTDDFRKTLGVI